MVWIAVKTSDGICSAVEVACGMFSVLDDETMIRLFGGGGVFVGLSLGENGWVL